MLWLGLLVGKEFSIENAYVLIFDKGNLRE